MRHTIVGFRNLDCARNPTSGIVGEKTPEGAGREENGTKRRSGFLGRELALDEVGRQNANGMDVAARERARARRPASPGQVSVRLAASEADILAMIALGRAMHAEGRFKKFFYDETRLLAAGRAALKLGNPGIILAERNGELVGMATAVASEQFFSPAKVASLHLLYVRRDARHGRAGVLLLRALRRWAQAAGALELNISTTMGVDMARSDRFLRRLGFKQTGGNYVMEGLG